MNVYTAAKRLKEQGIKAKAGTFEYVKDVHGWQYDRTGYYLEIFYNGKKKFTLTNESSPNVDTKRLAAFGLALAALGEPERRVSGRKG